MKEELSNSKLHKYPISKTFKSLKTIKKTIKKKTNNPKKSRKQNTDNKKTRDRYNETTLTQAHDPGRSASHPATSLQQGEDRVVARGTRCPGAVSQGRTTPAQERTGGSSAQAHRSAVLRSAWGARHWLPHNYHPDTCALPRAMRMTTFGSSALNPWSEHHRRRHSLNN